MFKNKIERYLTRVDNKNVWTLNKPMASLPLLAIWQLLLCMTVSLNLVEINVPIAHFIPNFLQIARQSVEGRWRSKVG